ncbi:MAG: hypothetical protein H0W30_11935 [Gemmatimonadaceae bacterium]|nr:hypothetical protein [Gemmatimonadaceae bacterium]MDQ3517570.1 hypothetical protein [Gemmatimonadota bacterium]
MIGVSSVSEAPFGIFFAIVAAVVLIAAWVILAGSRFIQGGVVERPERVPQLYGYTMCLVGLLMAVMAALSLTEAVLRLRSPEQGSGSEWGSWEPSVTSFEAFRATYERSREMRSSPNDPKPEQFSEEELRRRYEGLRTDRIARTRLEAQHTLVTSLLSVVIGGGLFVFHWRWLRSRQGALDGVVRSPTSTMSG